MNSTRPITSAERWRSTAPVAALALVALGAGAVAVADLTGAAARAIGISEARLAAELPIGAERDGRLDRAQASLTEALGVHGGDAAVWAALSQTRYLQATSAEVRTVSPVLLAAALDAGRRAARLAPESAEAQARLAEAASLAEGRAREAAGALARSYAAAPLSETLAPSRVSAAGRVWALLDANQRTLAIAEACLAQRAGATLAPVFAAVTLDPACASPDRDSSPQSP